MKTEEKTNKQTKLVVFLLDDQRFALSLHIVERIERIVEVKPLPKAPEYILGTINFHGEFLPVLNIRKLFELPNKEINLSDQLIITDTPKRRVALWVDNVSDIIEQADKEIIKNDKILMDNEYIEGVFKFNDEMVMLHNLDEFLRSKEETFLKSTIKKEEKRKNTLTK